MNTDIIVALAAFASFVSLSYLMIYVLLRSKEVPQSKPKGRKRSVNRGGVTKIGPKTIKKRKRK